MSNIKTILKQTVNMILYWGISVSLGFVSNLVYARVLGRDVFGEFALGRTIISFLPLVSLFGLHKGLLRQGSIALGQKNVLLYERIRNYTISFAMIIGFSVGLLTLIGADVIAADFFKKPELATEIRWFSFIIPVLVSSNMVMSLYQVNKKADRGQFLYQVVYFSLLLLIFVICIPFLKSSPLIIASFLAGHIVYFILLMYYQHKMGYRFSLKIEKSEKKKIFGISLPQCFSAVFNQSTKWSDTILLGILGTSAQVGIYQIGLRISNFVSIPAAAMSTIFMPIAARLLGQQKHEEINSLYKTLTSLVFGLGTLAFGTLFFMKSYLVELFGQGYEDASNILIVLLVSEAIDFGVGPARQLITISGGGKINLVNSIIMLAINITASCLLIPRYGILGAALANAITNAILQIVTVIELMAFYKLSPFSKKYFLQIALFVICIVGIYLLPVSQFFSGKFISDFIKVAVFLGVLGGLYGTVIINRKERQKIKQMFSQRKEKKKKRFQEEGGIIEKETDIISESL